MDKFLKNLDFSALETRMSNKYDTIILGVNSDAPVITLTGRKQSEPQFQELPGVKELHKAAWKQLLETTFTNRQRLKDLSFIERYSSSPYAVNNVGADHPTRKREPKGPRGKWGKL